MNQLRVRMKEEMVVSREAHLWLAQERALKYLAKGEWKDAIASMLSDLSDHPKLEQHPGKLVSFYCNGLESTRKWIEAFE